MSDLALEDIKLLDLTWHVAGPLATKLFADMGADVIKVERPPDGDPARKRGPFLNDDPHPEKSGLFLHLNTNKRSITLNLKTQRGRQIVRELVSWADVVMESFSPRVLPSLGLSYDVISSWNPKVVLVSISNFGQYGPYRDYQAEDLTNFAMGGPMLMTGVREGKPYRYALDISLYQGGAVAAVATMTALMGARIQGEGDHVDVSLYETLMGAVDRRSVSLVGYAYTGQTFTRNSATGTRIGGILPCKNGYINISMGEMRFPQLLKMLGNPDVSQDPRFATPEARQEPENAEAFNGEYLLPWLMERTMLEAWEASQAVGLISGPIRNVGDVLADPVFRQRGAWAELEHPVAGKLTYPGRQFIMTESPSLLTQPREGAQARPAPLLGQHNQEVYCGMLGYSKDDLVKLREVGVV